MIHQLVTCKCQWLLYFIHKSPPKTRQATCKPVYWERQTTYLLRCYQRRWGQQVTNLLFMEMSSHWNTLTEKKVLRKYVAGIILQVRHMVTENNVWCMMLKCFHIDRVALLEREIMHLVTSIRPSVCPSVCAYVCLFVNISRDMDYFPTFLSSPDYRQTDYNRQKAMHMSPSCKFHRWAQIYHGWHIGLILPMTDMAILICHNRYISQ